MTSLLLPTLLLFAANPASPGLAPVARAQFLQLSIHQRIVIRIPRVLGGRRDQRSEPPPELRWAERKGPRCVPLGSLEGAIITGDDSVDLLIADGARLRAKFDKKCPPLDFYSGLYIKGTADGMVCADRDSIRARSGSACQIDGFKRLALKRK